MIRRALTPIRLVLISGVVAAAGLLGVVVAMSSVSTTPEAEAAAKAPGNKTKIAPPPSFEAPPFDRFRTSLDRPMFHPDRRPLPDSPPPAAEPVVEALVPPPAGFRLKGAMITPDRRIAILETAEASQSVRLAEGDNLNGWTLASIEARRATFRLRDQTFVLELATPEQQ